MSSIEMPSKPSLAGGVVRSANMATMARRYNANRAPAGIGLSLAAIVSVTLWIAAGAGVHFVIAAGLHLMTNAPIV